MEYESMKEELSSSDGNSQAVMITTREASTNAVAPGAGNRAWFSDWVRTARGPRSLREFSEVTGCAVGQLSQLETGKSTNPEWSTILRIAEHSQGRCVMPKLELNLPPAEPVAALEEAAEKWRSNPQDPDNINLAVSIALREVARCMVAENAKRPSGEEPSGQENSQIPGDYALRRSNLPRTKPKPWRARPSSNAVEMHLQTTVPPL